MSRFKLTVPPEWIDYNGHMGDFAYGKVFSDGVIDFLIGAGFGPPWREATGHTFYAIDKRIRFSRECHRGERLEVETILTGLDQRRIALAQTLRGEDGVSCATCGFVLIHVDQTGERPKAAPIPPRMHARLAALHQPSACPETRELMAQPVRMQFD